MDLLNHLKSDFSLPSDAYRVVFFEFGLQKQPVRFVSDVVLDAWSSSDKNILGRWTVDTFEFSAISKYCILSLLTIRKESFVIGNFNYTRRLNRNLIPRDTIGH